MRVEWRSLTLRLSALFRSDMIGRSLRTDTTYGPRFLSPCCRILIETMIIIMVCYQSLSLQFAVVIGRADA